MTEQPVRWSTVPSPVGELLLLDRGAGLAALWMSSGRRPKPDVAWRRDDAPFGEVRAQLRAYFAGELVAFDLPLDPRGSQFQLRVWEGLRAIPYGETRSYGELAESVGYPGAARAVGSANARNPISIVVPCHRVIGSSGALTGYGGGLDNKRLLLDLERSVLAGWPREALALVVSGQASRL